ncbi:hypothetical protein JANAI62_29330 [Jannaschia pagri]|uniref:Uncharacterized protein n=1 Tax=Jannaschia pagri TaxID=2829797 RepID=A0ABQ4NPI8_9RHOB|nr:MULTISPECIES: hypothetical protein [unclassified Jannaschia]GIT92475.1 hypothetical protein JANAI61_29330 [Jannaschia sp. AI_61]GIT96310.1 hypothetical protein JANAI62_29330 [Jannaschia sp. AI_62]
MPLDRFVLIIVAVIAAAGATIWLAALVSASFAVPFAWIALAPAALAAWIGWRVIADRVRSQEDDHYDRME